MPIHRFIRYGCWSILSATTRTDSYRFLPNTQIRLSSVPGNFPIGFLRKRFLLLGLYQQPRDTKVPGLPSAVLPDSTVYRLRSRFTEGGPQTSTDLPCLIASAAWYLASKSSLVRHLISFFSYFLFEYWMRTDQPRLSRESIICSDFSVKDLWISLSTVLPHSKRLIGVLKFSCNTLNLNCACRLLLSPDRAIYFSFLILIINLPMSIVF